MKFAQCLSLHAERDAGMAARDDVEAWWQGPSIASECRHRGRTTLCTGASTGYLQNPLIAQTTLSEG